MMSLAEKFGALLLKARQPTPRREFARDNGVSDTQILRIEKGQANPTLAKLEELEELYGIEFTVTATKRKGRNGRSK